MIMGIRKGTHNERINQRVCKALDDALGKDVQIGSTRRTPRAAPTMITKKCHNCVANTHRSMLSVHRIPPAARKGWPHVKHAAHLLGT